MASGTNGFNTSRFLHGNPVYLRSERTVVSTRRQETSNPGVRAKAMPLDIDEPLESMQVAFNPTDPRSLSRDAPPLQDFTDDFNSGTTRTIEEKEPLKEAVKRKNLLVVDDGSFLNNMIISFQLSFCSSCVEFDDTLSDRPKAAYYVPGSEDLANTKKGEKGVNYMSKALAMFEAQQRAKLSEPQAKLKQVNNVLGEHALPNGTVPSEGDALQDERHSPSSSSTSPHTIIDETGDTISAAKLSMEEVTAEADSEAQWNNATMEEVQMAAPTTSGAHIIGPSSNLRSGFDGDRSGEDVVRDAAVAAKDDADFNDYGQDVQGQRGATPEQLVTDFGLEAGAQGRADLDNHSNPPSVLMREQSENDALPMDVSRPNQPFPNSTEEGQPTLNAVVQQSPQQYAHTEVRSDAEIGEPGTQSHIPVRGLQPEKWDRTMEQLDGLGLDASAPERVPNSRSTKLKFPAPALKNANSEELQTSGELSAPERRDSQRLRFDSNAESREIEGIERPGDDVLWHLIADAPTKGSSKGTFSSKGISKGKSFSKGKGKGSLPPGYASQQRGVSPLPGGHWSR